MIAMRVVEVVPVVKGVAKSTLSYFTKESPKIGSFVKIPLRNGSATGVVLGEKDVRQVKSELRKANFPLKKLVQKSTLDPIDPGLLKAVYKTAEYYATTPGSVFSSIFGKILLENPEFIVSNFKRKKDESKKEIKLLQLDPDERYREYRAIVRECFARKASAILIVPTIEAASQINAELSAGIENFVFELASLKGPELKRKLKKLFVEKHPVLIITTPSLATLGRPDVDTLIFEKENSRAYRTLTRPYMHWKRFFEFLATEKGLNLIFGDSVLSMESLFRQSEGELSDLTPLTWRLKQDAESQIVDMRSNKNFEIFSEYLVQLLHHAKEKGEKTFLFAVRKGISSLTICGDCASLLLCKNCGAPVVLHKEEAQSYYLCHHCRAKRKSETRCDTCHSWKLVPLGIGVDRVYELLRIAFPERNVYVVDGDHTPTPAKAKSVIQRFEQSRDGILVGTEQSLNYMHSVPNVAVISLDSLFAVSDFHINERIFYLITSLRQLASKKFMLQTRNANKEVLDYAVVGNILDFYRAEIRERHELTYPPYSIFIKVEGDIDRTGWEKDFEEWHPHFLGNTMILRIHKENWPDQDLLAKLLLLPPSFLIKVDTESIF